MANEGIKLIGEYLAIESEAVSAKDESGMMDEREWKAFNRRKRTIAEQMARSDDPKVSALGSRLLMDGHSMNCRMKIDAVLRTVGV